MPTVPGTANDAPPQKETTPAPTSVTAPQQAAGSGQTVEAFFADLIRPQVEAWLEANLPEIVQKLAADEIARLIGQQD